MGQEQSTVGIPSTPRRSTAATGGGGLGGRRRSSILPNGQRSSLIALENGALETNQRRSSIGGRLGGSIRATPAQQQQQQHHQQTLADLAKLYDDEDTDEESDSHHKSEGATATTATTEASPLVVKKVAPPPPPSFSMALQDPPPTLLVWLLPAIACATAYALYNIFIKKGSASIHPILGGVVLQFVAALLGSVLLGVILMQEYMLAPCTSSTNSSGDSMEYEYDSDNDNDPSSVSSSAIEYDRAGLWWSCCAGLAVGTAEMLSFCVSGMGVPATQSIPIIIGGSVVVGAVLGLILLGEHMMFHGWSGIGLLVIGIGLVATDPGDKVEEGGGGGGEATEAPPLLVWIGPALLCATAYALYACHMECLICSFVLNISMC